MPTRRIWNTFSTQLQQFLREQGKDFPITVLPGVELTHVAPARIAPLARRAKELGAAIVVVHGETIVEPVEPGTDRAAVECTDVDILAHPGFITLEEARLAAQNGIVARNFGAQRSLTHQRTRGDDRARPPAHLWW
jgi:histidinol phosphatase-like PHP family hydrolase